MNDIILEGNKLSPDILVDLYDLDATAFIGDDGEPGVIHRITNTPTEVPILWRGNSYSPVPFKVENLELRADGVAPARPTLTLSNVNRFVIQAVLALGDLSGLKVTRWRTFFKYTDGQPEENRLMHYPTLSWVITRKSLHTKDLLEFEMANVLDRPGLKLPSKQILRDKGFPGVGRVRR